jgi:hypothetical protein
MVDGIRQHCLWSYPSAVQLSRTPSVSSAQSESLSFHASSFCSREACDCDASVELLPASGEDPLRAMGDAATA